MVKKVIKKIMLAADVTKRSKSARAFIADLHDQLHADVVVVNIIDTTELKKSHLVTDGTHSYTLDKFVEIQKEKRDAHLKGGLVKEIEATGENVKVIVEAGNPLDEILKFIESEKADLLIIGTKWGKVSDVLLGSMAETLVRKSPIPVLCLPIEEVK